MSKQAAALIALQIKRKPDSVLGLATGDTPLLMYQELVRIYQKGELDFSKVKTFNLDEYLGLEKEDPQSYFYYMKEQLFRHINIQPENINIPNGMAQDRNLECSSYEAKIKETGGIDLQVLGIGVNGHIGFNEPDKNFEALTHVVSLDEKTIISNARFFESMKEVPTKAISMGIKTIFHAKKVVLLANGETKAKAVAKMVRGKIIPKVPASILQLHKDVTIVVDQEAGQLLQKNEIHR